MYGDGVLLAKGDHDKAMTAITNQQATNNQNIGNLRTQFQNQYKNAYTSDQDLKNTVTQGYKNYLDPDNLDNLFKSLTGGGSGGWGGVSGGIDPSLIDKFGADTFGGYEALSHGLSNDFRTKFEKSMGDLDTGINSYKNFIDTGGFSPEDIAAMRAQGVAPTRQIYQNAQDNLATAMNTAHGNMGNESVARSRMAADAADKIGAVNTSTEANLAQLKQQGKEFGTTGLTQASLGQAQARTAVEQLDAQLKEAGLGGMTDIEKTRLQAQLQNASLNQSASGSNASLNAQMAALKAQLPLSALKGLTDLYGTTPADTALGDNTLLQLQNLDQNGGQNLINARIGASQMPSNFDIAMGRVGTGLKIAGQVGAAIGTGGASLALPGGGLYGPGSMFGGGGSKSPYQSFDYGDYSNAANF
jgi:hypothetical protein